MKDREFDIVLHGASGYVGRLTAAELAAHGEGARIALSGRSEQRLRRVRDALGVGWALVETDSTDPVSVGSLAGRAAVVASAVGPYARYGLPLVRACARAGTSYADLSGETLFVRDSIDTSTEAASRTGARIVHSVGFDSVPSDLGVLLLHERVAADGEGSLAETALVLVRARGGLSGGTIDSARAEVEAVEADPGQRGVLRDPYALSPDRAADPRGDDERDLDRPRYDPLVGQWVAPFVMGPYNSRVVRRSTALLGHAYGPTFRYHEVIGAGTGGLAPVRAAALTGVQAALGAALRHTGTRAALDRVVPRPGSGPSERARERGYFRMQVHTRTTTGARYVATVAASGDPGYAATSVMFGQGALCLAMDDLETPVGVLTPAVAMGDALVRRLRDRGFQLSVHRLT